MNALRGITGRQLIVLLTTVALGIGGITSILLSHPHELSYYNVLVGGVDGAEEKGYEVTYWGESLNREVVSDLNRLLPPKARLKTLALHGKVLVILQEWGRLRPDIRINPPPPYDAYLMQYRRGFWGRTEQTLYEQAIPAEVWGFKDVPLLMLYLTNRPGTPAAPPSSPD
jgi:hypothetical protein